MPDNKQTRDAVAKANQELTRAKTTGTSQTAARVKLRKAIAEWQSPEKKREK